MAQQAHSSSANLFVLFCVRAPSSATAEKPLSKQGTALAVSVAFHRDAPADRKGDPYDLIGFQRDAPADRRGDPYDLIAIETGTAADRKGDPYDLIRCRAAGLRTPLILCTTGASCLD